MDQYLIQVLHTCTGHSRKLSVVLKLILQLRQVGDNALTLIGLLVIIHTYNGPV